jgi:hypothetical protein
MEFCLVKLKDNFTLALSGAVCRGLKRPGHQTNHSPLCIAEVKNARSCRLSSDLYNYIQDKVYRFLSLSMRRSLLQVHHVVSWSILILCEMLLNYFGRFGLLINCHYCMCDTSNTNVTFFLNVMPCSRAERYGWFAECTYVSILKTKNINAIHSPLIVSKHLLLLYPEDGSRTVLRNVGKRLAKLHGITYRKTNLRGYRSQDLKSNLRKCNWAFI